MPEIENGNIEGSPIPYNQLVNGIISIEKFLKEHNEDGSILADFHLISNTVYVFKNDYWKYFDVVFSISNQTAYSNVLLKNKSKIIDLFDQLNNSMQDIIHEGFNDFKTYIIISKSIVINILEHKQHIDSLLILHSEKVLEKAIVQSNNFLSIEKNLNERLSLLKNQTISIENLLDKETKDTTEYLNRQGLCKSFYDRSQILKHESNKWWNRLLLILALLLSITSISLYMELPYITSENIDFIMKKHLLFLPPSILFFWFLWITTKKHLYYSRLSDDYNYKNDISMAYYGYKKEILSEGKEYDALRLKLLDNVLAIITKNPVDSEMKTDTSPYTEIISKLLDQIKKEK